MDDEKKVEDQKELIINKHISEKIYWLRTLLIYFTAFLTVELIVSMNFPLLIVNLLFILMVYVLRHNNNRENIKYDAFFIVNYILTVLLILGGLLQYDSFNLYVIPISAGYSIFSLIVYYTIEKDLPSTTTMVWKFIMGASFFIIVPFIAYVFIFTIT
jgi:hypothetical protein